MLRCFSLRQWTSRAQAALGKPVSRRPSGRRCDWHSACFGATHHSGHSDWESECWADDVMSREEDVGITQYVNSLPGFTGILKHRQELRA